MDMLPDLQPIALLSSVSGAMQFFTNDALMLWMQMEAQLTRLNAGVPDYYPVHVSGKPGNESPNHPSRLDPPDEAQHASKADHRGFSLSQWITYAKKKNQIVSSTARLNGVLRTRTLAPRRLSG